MDLDGDGHLDVISGSWPGELYLFRNQGDGTYAASETLKTQDGEEIKVGSASAVHAADWNGNGLLDLLVGNIQGEVYLVPNEGSTQEPAFGPPQRLEAGGQPIAVPNGDAGPFVADWDGDGLPDLLVGAGDGSVRWFRNEGSAEQPQLAASQTLIPPADSGNQQPQQGESPGRGTRAKICVTDWNEDGRLDLLLGDFAWRASPPTEPTEEEKAAQARAQELLAERLQQHRELQKPVPDETPEARRQREEQLVELGQEIVQLMGQSGQARAAGNYQGHVWLFLRQPDDPVAQQEE